MAGPAPGAPTRRPLTIPPLGAGPALDAMLELPAGGAGPTACVVICHPHPLYGGNRDNNVVRALADGALSVGFAALCFDFRGVGTSEGSHDQGHGERDDARAALAAAAAQPELDAARIALAGYSSGGGVAAGVVADASADGETGPWALALIAAPIPPPAEVRAALVGYARPLLLASGEHDRFCSAEALSALAAERAERGAATQTLIAPGVDHFWLGSERRLADRAGAFLAGALGG